MEPNEPVAPEAAPARDYTGDEHWGIGGRYVIDPRTGRRVPEPAEAAPIESTPAELATPKPPEQTPEGADQ